MLGKHTVCFAPDIDESYMESYTQEDYVAGKPPPPARASSPLPIKYLTPTSSGLTGEVIAGSNTRDFHLLSDVRSR